MLKIKPSGIFVPRKFVCKVRKSQGAREDLRIFWFEFATKNGKNVFLANVSVSFDGLCMGKLLEKIINGRLNSKFTNFSFYFPSLDSLFQFHTVFVVFFFFVN